MMMMMMFLKEKGVSREIKRKSKIKIDANTTRERTPFPFFPCSSLSIAAASGLAIFFFLVFFLVFWKEYIARFIWCRGVVVVLSMMRKTRVVKKNDATKNDYCTRDVKKEGPSKKKPQQSQCDDVSSQNCSSSSRLFSFSHKRHVIKMTQRTKNTKKKRKKREQKKK